MKNISCLYIFHISSNTLFYMMKFSRAISRVKRLSGEKTNVSKTISVLRTRGLHHTQSPGKQQIPFLYLKLVLKYLYLIAQMNIQAR
jgi:hypothetical protein